jgi:hypothetical protein
MHKLAILAKLFNFFFWRTTSRQTHQIRLVYATDNFFKWLGPYITHSSVALPFHPIQGKRRERPIKIHCRVQYIINLLSLHAILNYSFFFITFRFGKISFRLISFRLISFRFISFRLISFRFVSIGFVSFRSISHFTGTLVFLATEQKPCIFHDKPRHRQFRRQITLQCILIGLSRRFPWIGWKGNATGECVIYGPSRLKKLSVV